MRTSVSAKRCPECGKAAMLQDLSCSVCGHRFRTRFAEPPVEKTQAFTLVVTPSAAARPPRRAGAVRTRLPAASAFHSSPVSPALHLYQAIKPMMSLYDLDKAAGGMGRVVRASDPHVLLLFYDYPPQSVHVSLSRADLASGDYQVQSVSLYQGNVLLQRHAGID